MNHPPLPNPLPPQGRRGDQRAVGLCALRDCGVGIWLGCLLDSRLRGNDKWGCGLVGAIEPLSLTPSTLSRERIRPQRGERTNVWLDWVSVGTVEKRGALFWFSIGVGVVVEVERVGGEAELFTQFGTDFSKASRDMTFGMAKDLTNLLQRPAAILTKRKHGEVLGSEWGVVDVMLVNPFPKEVDIFAWECDLLAVKFCHRHVVSSVEMK